MSNKATTKQIVHEAASKMGTYKRDMREALDCLTAVIAAHLSAGEAVQLHGLGVFRPVIPGQRTQTGRGRPRTKPAVRFRPALELFRRLLGGPGEKPENDDVSVPHSADPGPTSGPA